MSRKCRLKRSLLIVLMWVLATSLAGIVMIPFFGLVEAIRCSFECWPAFPDSPEGRLLYVFIAGALGVVFITWEAEKLGDL